MAGNTFGNIFRLTTFGESHGKAIGGIIDGCPAGLNIDLDFIQQELDRRRPGQSTLTSARQEEDKVEFLSGIFEGKSTGAPIAFIIWNKDQKPEDYDQLKDLYRPSHADFTYDQKYGFQRLPWRWTVISKGNSLPGGWRSNCKASFKSRKDRYQMLS